jgi:predicted ATPase
MFTYAKIHHFKSISEANLRLKNKNLIVGPNGSGKSNILDALYFLHDAAVDGIDTAITKRHGIDSIRQWSKTRPYNIKMDVGFANDLGVGSYEVVLSSVKGEYRIIEESGTWFGPHPRARYREGEDRSAKQSSFFRNNEGLITFSSGFNDLNIEKPTKIDRSELFISSLARRLVIPPLNTFKPIGDELTSFAKYSIYPNTLRNPQLVSREVALAEDGSNLASVLKIINSARRHTPFKENILSSLKQIMPVVTDFHVRSAAGYYVPVLRVEEASGELHEFNLSQISDGTLRVLGLLTAFYQPSAPYKIGVEEPEQMIHPGALQVIAEAVSDFTNDQARGGSAPFRDDARQVFLTTHSPSLLDAFEPEYIIWTRLRGGVTKSGPVSDRQTELIKQQLFSPGEILLAEGFFE